jgi:hypothetical protein
MSGWSSCNVETHKTGETNMDDNCIQIVVNMANMKWYTTNCATNLSRAILTFEDGTQIDLLREVKDD